LDKLPVTRCKAHLDSPADAARTSRESARKRAHVDTAYIDISHPLRLQVRRDLQQFGIYRALPVHGEPDFSSGPPDSAEEYLRRVRCTEILLCFVQVRLSQGAIEVAGQCTCAASGKRSYIVVPVATLLHSS